MNLKPAAISNLNRETNRAQHLVNGKNNGKMMSPTLANEERLEHIGLIIGMVKLQLLQGRADNPTSVRLSFDGDCNLLVAGVVLDIDRMGPAIANPEKTESKARCKNCVAIVGLVEFGHRDTGIRGWGTGGLGDSWAD